VPARIEGAPNSRSLEYKRAWYLKNRTRLLDAQRKKLAAKRVAAPPKVRRAQPELAPMKRPTPAERPKPALPLARPLNIQPGPALEAVRAWRSGNCNRVLVFQRSGAVKLVSYDGAVSWAASFASLSEAATALARDSIKWQRSAVPERSALVTSVRARLASQRNNL
jgi:hypothetical protein